MTDTAAAGLPPAELARHAEAGDMGAALLLARQLLDAGKAEESLNGLLSVWIRDRDQPIL